MPNIILDLLSNSIFHVIISAIAGGVGASFLWLIGNRRTKLKYSIFHNRIGLSAAHQQFGRIRVTVNDIEVSNLFASVVRIENSSIHDVEGFTLKIMSRTGCKIINGLAGIENTAESLPFDPEFIDLAGVYEGDARTQAQTNLASTNHWFRVDTLNRGQTIVVSCLISTDAGTEPWISVGVQRAGVDVLPHSPMKSNTHFLGVNIAVATILGLALLAPLFPLIAAAPIPPWILLSTGAFIGAVGAGLLGIAVIKLYQWTRKALIG